MIVTRRRKKSFPWRRWRYPLAALAVLVAALIWTPSRQWLAAGPLTTPLWNAAQPVWKPLAKPFDAAAQQGTIGSQAAQIARLTQDLNDAHAQIADRDKRISSLTSQLNDAQQQAASANAPKQIAENGSPRRQTAAVQNAGDLSQSATADMRRTAAVWTAMDSESAAKVVQRLPDVYVVRVFALMSPDAVGAILESLPPGYAARLTQERPELKR